MPSPRGKSDSEPDVIVFLRERLARADDEGRADDMPCATVVGASWNNLGGVRPELLCVNQSGEKVYMLTVRQVRKLLAAWDREVRDAVA